MNRFWLHPKSKRTKSSAQGLSTHSYNLIIDALNDEIEILQDMRDFDEDYTEKDRDAEVQDLVMAKEELYLLPIRED